MSAASYDDLRAHVGHRITCSVYTVAGTTMNVALECEDCYEVLLDFDRPDDAPSLELGPESQPAWEPRPFGAVVSSSRLEAPPLSGEESRPSRVESHAPRSGLPGRCAPPWRGCRSARPQPLGFLWVGSAVLEVAGSGNLCVSSRFPRGFLRKEISPEQE